MSESEQRRLAAIVFTDIIGYSSLAQSNETQALQLLSKHNLLVRTELTKFRGREVKTIGDSFLIEFESALEAVLCAIRIQQAIRNQNLGIDNQRERLSVRIGIHVGDVIHRDGDVFGDAVNIASRIVNFAESGGVCLSEQVYAQVRNKIEYQMIELPSQHLRHIEQPMDLYQIVLPWDNVRTPTLNASSKAKSSVRIAVLPFVSISPDPKDSYFADGLTEELISDLSEIQGLRVIARSSVGKYGDSSRSTSQIGIELDVGYVVEGSVRKSGNKIRATAQLIDVESLEHVWSNHYDRDLEDIFSIQSDISKKIVDSLKVTLLKDEKQRIEKKDTENLAAYVAYLKGRTMLNLRTEEVLHSAMKQFELAIKEDPNYAKAYAGLADLQMLLGDYLFAPVPVALDEAKRNIERALELDPDLPEAHVSLAYFLQYEYKFVESRKEFERAIALNPSYATAHHWYAGCLEAFGEADKALQEALIAEELDPLSSAITLSTMYRFIGIENYAEALKRVKKLQEIDPNNPFVGEALMAYSFAKKDWNNALNHLKAMMSIDPSDPYLDADLAYIQVVTGRKDEALELIRKIENVPDNARTKGALLAFVYAGMGDLDQTFRWLEFAFENREVFFGWVRNYPHFKKVKEDRRFAALLEKAGLPTDSENERKEV